MKTLNKSIEKHFNWICIGLLLIYGILLLININKIPLFIGDEGRYWESVQSLMEGHVGTNNHPLFGKTFWLVIVNLFYIFTGTDMPLFWRAGTIIFTLLTLIIFYKLLNVYFSKYISLVGTVLLATDPMFFAFGRLLQLELPMLFFALSSIYFLISYSRNNKNGYLITSSLFLGLSLAVKLTSLPALIISLFFLIYTLKKFKKALNYLLLTLISFIAGNIMFVVDYGVKYFPEYLYKLLTIQFNYFPQTGDYQNSSAFTWFSIPQIMTLYRVPSGSRVEEIIALQNPVTFVLSLLVMFGFLYFLVIKRPKSKIPGLVFLYMISYYLPWLFNIRTTYYYYILPVIPFLIFGLLYVSDVLFKSYKNISSYFKIGLVTFSTIFFIILYPLLVAFSVPIKYDLNIYKYSLIKYSTINNLFCQNCYPRK